MKRITLSTVVIPFSLVISLLLFSQPTEAQKANKIIEYLQKGNVKKAVEKRNQVYSNDGEKELMLADICDCILFNTKGYKAYDPYKAYAMFKEIYPQYKESPEAGKFLAKYNTSFEQIQLQIENNILADAKGINTEEAYVKALSVCDSCSYLNEAKALQEEAIYHYAISEGTIEGYNYFLSRYPESDKAEEITSLVDKMVFGKIDNTIEAYNAFIQQYPKSKLIPEAQNRIYAIVYDNATKKNSMEAYAEMLQLYPNHPQKANIQGKVEKYYHDKLTAQFTLKDYDTFVGLFPQSKYISQVKALAKPINQNEWHWKSEGLKGYVQTTKETISNEGSSTIYTLTKYNESGEMTMRQTSVGKEVKKMQFLYNTDHSLNKIISSNEQKRYEYQNHLLNKITFIDSNNKATTASSFKYDKEGNVTERTDYIPGEQGHTVTKYSYSNHELSATQTYNSLSPQNTVEQQFSNGKLTSSTEKKDGLAVQKQYTYNDNGDVVQISTTQNGKEPETITYEYQYDASGNWTKQTSYINGAADTVKQRTLEYFYTK